MFRAGCVSPSLKVADCAFNAKKIIDLVNEAEKKNIRFLVFPELCITGYTCADLFLQDTLLCAATKALLRIAEETRGTAVLTAVGLPFKVNNGLYNCAAFVYKGKIIAMIPKSFIPNYSEFYEKRWFSASQEKIQQTIFIDDENSEVPFSTNILIEDKKNPLIKISAEICEDLWVPLSPSTLHALNNATVIANLSASNEVIGKAEYRRTLVKAQSAKTITAYLYANAGRDESTTDMVFSGHNLIALNGSLKTESRLFEDCSKIIYADLDLELIQNERLRTTSFSSSASKIGADPFSDYCSVFVDFKDNTFSSASSQNSIGFSALKNGDTCEKDCENDFAGIIERHPFVPSDEAKRSERCREVVELQAEGLAKRLRHINAKNAVIGLSGGLDSTLALLVTCRAFDKCGLNRSGILCVTMPCFGTTGRTYNNACSLAKNCHASLKEIDIKKAVLQHFEDIGQDENIHDVTYENSQARERTQILMDIANKNNGIVIGTGDLSELALGWCTYNGDQMSMYGVNSSIPKTLVRYLVGYFADEAESNKDESLTATLQDILDTPVSPELLPPEKGNISQKTEELVGPYELHDFFLYYVLRRSFSPKKIFFLAKIAFKGEKQYSDDIILKWLKNFYKRFFSQQFKRSCMPDGAKVGTVSLSPRGDWRMPSDASAALWLNEIEELEKGL